MGESEEEIIIPTETQGLSALRRGGLVAFIAATIIILGLALSIVILK